MIVSLCQARGNINLLKRLAGFVIAADDCQLFDIRTHIYVYAILVECNNSQDCQKILTDPKWCRHIFSNKSLYYTKYSEINDDSIYRMHLEIPSISGLGVGVDVGVGDGDNKIEVDYFHDVTAGWNDLTGLVSYNNEFITDVDALNNIKNQVTDKKGNLRYSWFINDLLKYKNTPKVVKTLVRLAIATIQDLHAMCVLGTFQAPPYNTIGDILGEGDNDIPATRMLSLIVSAVYDNKYLRNKRLHHGLFSPELLSCYDTHVAPSLAIKNLIEL
jgi:hypothetical protein